MDTRPAGTRGQSPEGWWRSCWSASVQPSQAVAQGTGLEVTIECGRDLAVRFLSKGTEKTTDTNLFFFNDP